MAKRKLSYSEAIQHLEVLTDRLKKEDIPLEELPDAIKQAKEMISYCKNLLRSVEQEINPTSGIVEDEE